MSFLIIIVPSHLKYDVWDTNFINYGDRVLERFWDRVKVDELTKCWNWQGTKQQSGYGHFKENGKTVLVHRFAYEVNKGKIPKELTVDHLCKNTSCVNPEHMELVTRGVNTLRGNGITSQNTKKTHCPYGHELRSDNLVPNVLIRDGFRNCLMCTRKQDAFRQRINRAIKKIIRQEFMVI